MIRRQAFFVLLLAFGAARPSPAAEPPPFYATAIAPFFELAATSGEETFYYLDDDGAAYRYERRLSDRPSAEGAASPAPADLREELRAELVGAQTMVSLQDRILPAGWREEIVLVTEPTFPIPGELTARLDFAAGVPRRVAVEVPAALGARLLDTPVGSPPAALRRTTATGRLRLEWVGEARVDSQVWLSSLAGWEDLADVYRRRLDAEDGKAGAAAAATTATAAAAFPSESVRERAGRLYRLIAAMEPPNERRAEGDAEPRSPLTPPGFTAARQLRAWLADFGIPSSLALVNSRRLGAIETRSPDFRQFDRALLAIESNGEPVFADFSLPGLDFGQVAPQSGARQAFLVPPGSGWRFAKTPPGEIGRALELSALEQKEAAAGRVWRSSEDWWPSWESLEAKLGLPAYLAPQAPPQLGDLVELGQRFGSLLRQNDPHSAFAILRDLALAARRDAEMALELSGSLLYLASLRPDLSSEIHEVAIILHRALPPFADRQSAARHRLLLAVHLIDAGRADEALEPLRDLLALKVGGELEDRGIHLLASVALATGQGREQAAEKLEQALRGPFPGELRESAVYQLIELYHQLGRRGQERRLMEREGFPLSSGEAAGLDLFAQAFQDFRSRFELLLLEYAEPASLADPRLAGKKIEPQLLGLEWLPPEKVKLAFLVAGDGSRPIARRASFLLAALPDLRSLVPRQSTFRRMLETIAGDRRFPAELRAAASAGLTAQAKPPVVSLALDGLRAQLLALRQQKGRPALAGEIREVQRLESLRAEDCRELLLADLETREMGLAGTPWWPGAFASCLDGSAESARLEKELAFAIVAAGADDGAKALALALLAAVLPNDAPSWPALVAGLKERVDGRRMPQTRQIVQLLELSRAMRRGEPISWQAEARGLDEANRSLLEVWQEQILLRDRDVAAVRAFLAARSPEELASPYGLDRRLELANLVPDFAPKSVIATAAKQQIYVLRLSSLANLSWSDGRTLIRLSRALEGQAAYPRAWFDALLAGTDNELGRAVLGLADAEAREDWPAAYTSAKRLIALSGQDFDNQWNLGRAAWHLATQDPRKQDAAKKEEARVALRLFVANAKDHPELGTARRLLTELGG